MNGVPEKQKKSDKSFLFSNYRNSELRIYGNYPNLSIQINLNTSEKYEWSKVYPAKNKTIEQCKELLYLFIKGWTSNNLKEKETIKEVYKLAIS